MCQQTYLVNKQEKIKISIKNSYNLIKFTYKFLKHKNQILYKISFSKSLFFLFKDSIKLELLILLFSYDLYNTAEIDENIMRKHPKKFKKYIL